VLFYPAAAKHWAGSWDALARRIAVFTGTLPILMGLMQESFVVWRTDRRCAYALWNHRPFCRLGFLLAFDCLQRLVFLLKNTPEEASDANDRAPDSYLYRRHFLVLRLLRVACVAFALYCGLDSIFV